MRAFRMAEALWELFGAAARRQGTTRGDLLRAFARWYVREPGAELPERPDDEARPSQ